MTAILKWTWEKEKKKKKKREKRRKTFSEFIQIARIFKKYLK